ncbi:aspartate transaminase [Shinella sp. CPCC 101442]|uniref:aspartate transaminase n=1 Tax=Shinella sp. CPCC 101442 TaxID=2932265 RepID=UPI0021520936|nr:aspartate transaminase [Shinella sp. CPCC 101442]MCR6497417.1 aspartate transaminase [Shinella sp. CPCC 101442]
MTEFQAASRVNRIKPSPSSLASARARDLKAEGRDIVDLTVGEPDFDTPENIKAAGIAAIQAGDTKYTAVNGTVALRKAILAKFERSLGLTYTHEQICVGGGAKQIIFLALMASVESGAEVIIPTPYWVSYPDMVLANNGKPVIVDCTEGNGFKLTAEALEAAITPNTRWLILNSPCNPSGSVYMREELTALAAVLLKHPHVWVLADEIYNEVLFDTEADINLAIVEPQLKERLFIVNGVSKTYAMTGWRIGYGVGNARLVAAINKLQSQMSSCPSSISQAAAVEALNGDQSFIVEATSVYRARRDLAVGLLNAVPGLRCPSPNGAFYVFPNCAGVLGRMTPDGKRIESDLDFILYMLESVGVAALHGSAYGMPGYFRLSIATSEETIREGCRRIAAAVTGLR